MDRLIAILGDLNPKDFGAPQLEKYLVVATSALLIRDADLKEALEELAENEEEKSDNDLRKENKQLKNQIKKINKEAKNKDKGGRGALEDILVLEQEVSRLTQENTGLDKE